MITAGLPRSDRPAARGMTLLEVLISCGVLVVGLASIASLLPAAGSRLGQAATEDRGGTLAANARTDAQARGLVAFDLFADANRLQAYGKLHDPQDREPFTDVNRNGTRDPDEPYADINFDGTWRAAGSSTLASRIDLQRGFLLEDEVVFSSPTTTETPVNGFVGGQREFKQGVCWGATLVPQTFPAKAGSPAVLGIAVFRKDPTPQSISLTQVSGGLYRITTLDEAAMKQFLRSCSSVLVPGTDPAKGPRWFRINASWRPLPDPVTGVRQNDGCYVAFADSEFATFAGANPTVIGFDNLIRVDQYNVILQ